MMKIKAITKSDDLKKIVLELQKEKWETLEFSFQYDDLERFVANPNNYLLMAYIDGNVVGMLEAYCLQKPDSRHKEMFLYEIETKNEYRNRGVAKSLILKLKDIAKKDDAHEIWVLTDKDNIPANNLYSSLGIQTTKSKQIMYNYPCL